MVTLQKSGGFYNRKILEIEGLKSDEKPLRSIEGAPIINGSTFKELDGDLYKYDEQNHRWLLQKTQGTDGTPGTDGREIELKANDTHIQWRYVGDETWTNLVDLSTLKGANGKAATIRVGNTTSSKPGTIALVTNSGTESDAVFDFVIPRGSKGDGLEKLSSIDLNTDGNLKANFEDGTIASINLNVPFSK